MRKTICILTATRAEFGLLKPIISRLNNIEDYDVKLAVTGAHLSSEFGLTYKEIEDEGFNIDEKIPILLSSDTPASISKSMGIAMISFSDYFERIKPDLLIVLGDRYETLAVAIAAMNQRIPIAHLYGGETTEGAIDESIRHAISKLSYLHFTSTETYRKRVIQLGESPDRVFNVGAVGIENIVNETLYSRNELVSELGLNLDKTYAVVTFHPVTLENNTTETQIRALLEVCALNSQLNFIFTRANADADGRVINRLIDQYAMEYNHIVAYASLGTKRYLSALKYADMVIGNSSSGLVEAPSFGIPTINIGDRQKGRMQSDSVINCDPTFESIQAAVKLAMNNLHVEKSKRTKNPYGDGNTSLKIVTTIRQFISEDKIQIKKAFYDIEV